MAYVQGELGEKIKGLIDEHAKQCGVDYDLAVNLLIEAWNELPDDKYQYDESYLIVWFILRIAVKTHNIDLMNEWVDKIFYADPERGDTGERDMWAGKVAYENGDIEKARSYFKSANKKSRGRCFGDNDKIYLELLAD